jgi:hypothetical protein
MNQLGGAKMQFIYLWPSLYCGNAHTASRYGIGAAANYRTEGTDKAERSEIIWGGGKP